MKRLVLGAAIVLPVLSLATVFVPCAFDCPPGERAAPERVTVQFGDATVLVPETALSTPRTFRPERAAVRRAPAPAATDAATIELQGVADTIAAYFRDGRRDAAEELIAADPRVLSFEEAAAGRDVKVESIYRDRVRGGELELRLTRAAGACGDEPIAVAFPPGTYGAAPRVQELALLRAPVVVLGAGRTEVSVDVPIACASFHLRAPTTDYGYELRRFEPGSAIDRLMVALCSGDGAPEADAQLAVWIVANDITRAQLESHPGVCTFQRAVPVGTWNADGAAELIRQSGVDPDGVRFYQKQAAPRPATPQRRQQETPAPAPRIEAGLS